MSNDKNLEKIAKYLSDNMLSEERESFFAWVEADADNKELLNESMEIWDAAVDEEETFEVDMDAAWGKVDERMRQKRNLQEATETLAVVSILRPLLKVAAAVILLLMGVLWYKDYTSVNDETTVVITQPQENTTVDLPDGSKVWLNGNSQLKYQNHFENRIVRLEGEAFFEVVKKDGQSFEIFAEDAKIIVLGTAFNVRAYPEETIVEVAVEEGSVQFVSEKKVESGTILTKKEFAIYNKATAEVKKQEGTQPNANSWKTKVLNLQQAKMSEAVEALERYFDIDIDVENSKILNCSWGNTIATLPNPDLETIISQINYSNPYAIKKIGSRTYTLSGKGCD